MSTDHQHDQRAHLRDAVAWLLWRTPQGERGRTAERLARQYRAAIAERWPRQANAVLQESAARLLDDAHRRLELFVAIGSAMDAASDQAADPTAVPIVSSTVAGDAEARA